MTPEVVAYNDGRLVSQMEQEHPVIPDDIDDASPGSMDAAEADSVSQDAQGVSQAVIDLKAAKQDLTELNQGKSGLENLLKQILTKLKEMAAELTSTEK